METHTVDLAADQTVKWLIDELAISDEPEEIDLAAFREQFLERGSGTAVVSVDAETPRAWSLYRRLLSDMERDLHER